MIANLFPNFHPELEDEGSAPLVLRAIVTSCSWHPQIRCLKCSGAVPSSSRKLHGSL